MTSFGNPLYTGYILSLALACGVSLLLFGYVWHRRAAQGAKPLLGVLISVLFWSTGYIIEYTSNDLAVKLFSFNISYIGSLSIQLMVLLFALQYCGLGKYVNKRNVALLSIIPVITLFVQWTKQYHSLLYFNISLAADGPFLLVVKDYGAWFWIWYTYSYLLLAAAVAVLVYRLFMCPGLYKRQIAYIILMLAIPIFANLLYVFRFIPVPRADWTPASLSITSIFMALLIFNRRLLEIIPIARESLIEIMSEGFIVTDSKGFVVDFNGSAQKMTRNSARIKIGEELPGVIASQLDLNFDNVMDQATEISLHGDKKQNYYIVSISKLYLKNRELAGYLFIFHDITDRKQSEELIKHLAYYDQLTALPNRYLFHDRAAMAIEHASRFKEKLAILMLDLDDFKNVNDSFGHEAGDRVLQEVGRRLAAAVRKVDTVSRFGGDEFVIMLTEISDEGIVDAVARRIVENMSPDYELNGISHTMTFSIGISVYPKDGKNLRDLMRNADLAMYEAKRLGHNRYQYFAAGAKYAE